jgi:hypothetical protein
VEKEEGEGNGANAPAGDDDDDDDEGGEGGGEEEAGVAVRNVADPALDLEVAWENLDLARAIVSRLLDDNDIPHDHDDGGRGNAVVPVKSDRDDDHDDDVPTDAPEGGRDELLIDLAQIHLRLGDLQRQNDNVKSCIDDYERSLMLRTKVVGRYDRKVANCHFSLAQAYAEAPNKISEGEGRVNAFVTGLVGSDGGASGDAGCEEGGGGGTSSSHLTEERKAEYRLRSSEHYLACGQSFAGMLAKMCGMEDAESFVTNASVDEISASPFASTASSALSSSSSSSSTSMATENATAMSRLRQRTSTLVPPPQTSSTIMAEIGDIREIMDEIQEAMDTAEDNEVGLKSLGEMKANAMGKREGTSGSATDDGGLCDGAVTTIGFGVAGPSRDAFGMMGGSGDAAVSFADATTATAAVQPTMMIVKKRKKTPSSEQSRGDQDPTKRLKTN